jgi:transcriptional regulator with XRE-family HTH domain
MEYFYYKEEKLKYILKVLKIQNKDIAQKLDIGLVTVANIKNYHQNRLRKHHLYAICTAYNIPLEIFENDSINTNEKVDNILKDRDEIFTKDYELLDKLKGDWYLYSYPSNSAIAEVWETETTIYEDFFVEDMHGNRGKLFIGKNQSIILKESRNSKNITSITFDNNRVAYGIFPFSRVSKANSINKELFNFGIFSHEKLEINKAKEILGAVKGVQLQMKQDILERINESILMKG